MIIPSPLSCSDYAYLGINKNYGIIVRNYLKKLTFVKNFQIFFFKNHLEIFLSKSLLTTIQNPLVGQHLTKKKEKTKSETGTL